MGPRGGRALTAFITILGIVAIGAGLYAALTGVAGMPGDLSFDRSVDSELRFFATFYVAFGALALWIAPRVATETTLVRAWALTLFVAGLTRAVSWLDVGRPRDLFLALLAAELIIPPVVVVWQRRLSGD